MRAVRAVLAALVAAGSLVFVSAPSSARQTGDAASITLVAQDLVVAAGGTASFAFSVGGTVPPDTEVVVEAYTKLTTARQDIRRIFAGELRNRDVGFVATSLDLVPADTVGRRTISLPTVTTSQERVLGGNALLPDAGIYPVTIELRSDNVPLAELRTAIVRVADGEQAPPLDVALVVPLDGAPTLHADGATVIADADRLRLQTVTGVLAGSATPLTVAPRPELIEGLGRTGLPADSDRAAALATAIGTRQVLAQPFVSMDPAALERAGLGGELTSQLTLGEDAIAKALPGVSTDRTTWVTGQRSSPQGVAMLRDLGVRRLVVPADTLDPAPDRISAPTTAIQVEAGGAALPVEVAVADPGLTTAFAATPDPVLGAYQYVAELLAIAADHPATTGRQGVVVVPPADWQPDPTFLATVLSLLGQSPLLHAVTLDQWFRDVAAPTDARHTLATANPADLSDFALGLTLTRVRLTALSSMLPVTDTLATSLAARLRVSVDDSFDANQHQAYLDAANGELNELSDAVDPVATRRITLAGRSTEVPITLHRRIDRPITVRVHLESPKLSFPDNDLLVKLDAETVQERVKVKARANGTFPLIVTIMTPEGDVPVAPTTELTVQATTLSGFGVVLSVGALLVLASWWVRHLRRNRRRKAIASGARHHPSAGPPAAPGGSAVTIGAP